MLSRNVPPDAPSVSGAPGVSHGLTVQSCCREHDVFNALDVFQNESFLRELKFGIGDGRLHLYLYNWQTSCNAQPGDVGLVLL